MSDDGRSFSARAEEFLALFQQGRGVHQGAPARERAAAPPSSPTVEDRQNRGAQSDRASGRSCARELLERIRGLEEEKRDVLERLRAVEEENRQFAERYLEIEEENNNLANLYVASYQLHSTLEPLRGAEDHHRDRDQPDRRRGASRSTCSTRRPRQLAAGGLARATTLSAFPRRRRSARAWSARPSTAGETCCGDPRARRTT